MTRRAGTVAAGEASEFARLWTYVEALERRVARFEAVHGARDREDRTLLEVLAASTQGLPFRVSWLFAHAQGDPTLAGALAAATVSTVGELGAWLRDRTGTHDGITIERLRGRRWRAYTSVRLCDGAEISVP